MDTSLLVMAGPYITTGSADWEVTCFGQLRRRKLCGWAEWAVGDAVRAVGRGPEMDEAGAPDRLILDALLVDRSSGLQEQAWAGPCSRAGLTALGAGPSRPGRPDPIATGSRTVVPPARMSPARCR